MKTTQIIYTEMVCTNIEKKRLELFNKYKCAICNFNLRIVWKKMQEGVVFPDVLLARLGSHDDGIGFRGIIPKNHDLATGVVCICKYCQIQDYPLTDMLPVHETGHFIPAHLLSSQIATPCDCILQMVTLNGPACILQTICIDENEQELIIRDGVIRHWSEIVYNKYDVLSKTDIGQELLVSEKALPFINLTI
jgi:hypothetical protein